MDAHGVGRRRWELSRRGQPGKHKSKVANNGHVIESSLDVSFSWEFLPPELGLIYSEFRGGNEGIMMSKTGSNLCRHHVQ